MTNVNTKTKTALAAVTLAAAALVTPLSASAADYQKCSDTTNSVAGGLIGGSVGAVAGREIAGRGDRSEGAIIGAIIGGIAGAAIGDGANDCEKDYRPNQRAVTTTNHYPTRTVVTNRNVQNVGYNTNRRATTNRGYNTNYGYNSRRVDPLYRVDLEIEQTRREGDRLKRQLRNARGHRPGLRRALEANGRHLKYLKKERSRIKKSYNNRSRAYR